MKNEKKIQWLILIKLLAIITCAMLYAWGGIEGKWLRRFVAPGIAGLTILGFSRDWRTLIKIPLLMASSSLGYGANELWMKVAKRGIVGLAMGISVGAYEAFMKKKWIYLGATIPICMIAYIILGVFNPFIARIEETMLGLIIYSLVILPANKEE